jgi:hypothetical protein
MGAKGEYGGGKPGRLQPWDGAEHISGKLVAYGHRHTWRVHMGM